MLHDDASDLDTGMPPLDRLMHQNGVRSVEIDIVPDPQGGMREQALFTGSRDCHAFPELLRAVFPLSPDVAVLRTLHAHKVVVRLEVTRPQPVCTKRCTHSVRVRGDRLASCSLYEPEHQYHWIPCCSIAFHSQHRGHCMSGCKHWVRGQT